MADRESLFFGIDIANHRLVGAEHDSRIHIDIAIFVQDRRRFVWQQLYKVLVGLRNKRSPIGQEQHVFDPVIAFQHIDKRNRDSNLARASRHDQEPFAVHLVVMFANTLDGQFLIVAIRDFRIHV